MACLLARSDAFVAVSESSKTLPSDDTPLALTTHLLGVAHVPPTRHLREKVPPDTEDKNPEASKPESDSDDSSDAHGSSGHDDISESGSGDSSDSSGSRHKSGSRGSSREKKKPKIWNFSNKWQDQDGIQLSVYQ
ncbi:unnamed protein product [Hyaloperonospora brassicae]|uniref:RxLR effector candidate protein n=1 Tax=Hyaloperonospora brassicae TaxID=162125 RepID=A0AAV0UGN8_HYABA|nr:unnamed protein product [Hyaloperonospora brassicae]